jgi:hypothetical protein
MLLRAAVVAERKSFHLGNKIILANIRVRERAEGVFTGSNCTISIEIIKISPKAKRERSGVSEGGLILCVHYTHKQHNGACLKLFFKSAP